MTPDPSLSVLAALSDPEAMRRLAIRYIEATASDGSFERGMALLNQAAAAGDADSLLLLGMYRYKRGHYFEAATLFDLSAKSGNEIAEYNALISRLALGPHVTSPQRIALEAKTLFDGGYSHAAGLLSIFRMIGFGLEKDCAIAFQLAEAAADSGDSADLYHLGLLYEFGCGTARDLARASGLYSKSLTSSGSKGVPHDLHSKLQDALVRIGGSQALNSSSTPVELLWLPAEQAWILSP